MINTDVFIKDLVTQLDKELPDFYMQLKKICSNCHVTAQTYIWKPIPYIQRFEDYIWYINNNMIDESLIIDGMIQCVKGIYEQSLTHIYEGMHHFVVNTKASIFPQNFVQSFNSLPCDCKALMNFGVNLEYFGHKIKGMTKDKNGNWEYRGIPIYSFALYNCSTIFNDSFIIADKNSLPYLDFDKKHFFYEQTNPNSHCDSMHTLEVFESLMQNPYSQLLEKCIVGNSLVPLLYSLDGSRIIRLKIVEYDW